MGVEGAVEGEGVEPRQLWTVLVPDTRGRVGDTQLLTSAVVVVVVVGVVAVAVVAPHLLAMVVLTTTQRVGDTQLLTPSRL